LTPDAEQQIKESIANLKELLCTKIEALERLTEERFQDAEQALKIQAAEYERRLEALNNEAARINQAAARSVSRELFDATIKSLDDKVHHSAQYGAQTKGMYSGSTITITIMISIGALLLALAGIAVNILSR